MYKFLIGLIFLSSTRVAHLQSFETSTNLHNLIDPNSYANFKWNENADIFHKDIKMAIGDLSREVLTRITKISEKLETLDKNKTQAKPKPSTASSSYNFSFMPRPIQVSATTMAPKKNKNAIPMTTYSYFDDVTFEFVMGSLILSLYIGYFVCIIALAINGELK